MLVEAVEPALAEDEVEETSPAAVEVEEPSPAEVVVDASPEVP